MPKELSRRKFLQHSAGTAAAISAANSVFLGDSRPEAISYLEVPPSDRVRFGIIGVGMQGSDLLKNSIELPGVECVAACDLYDGRHRLAREIAGARVDARGDRLLRSHDAVSGDGVDLSGARSRSRGAGRDRRYGRVAGGRGGSGKASPASSARSSAVGGRSSDDPRSTTVSASPLRKRTLTRNPSARTHCSRSKSGRSAPGEDTSRVYAELIGSWASRTAAGCLHFSISTSVASR